MFDTTGVSTENGVDADSDATVRGGGDVNEKERCCE